MFSFICETSELTYGYSLPYTLVCFVGVYGNMVENPSPRGGDGGHIRTVSEVIGRKNIKRGKEKGEKKREKENGEKKRGKRKRKRKKKETGKIRSKMKV